jgi:hypothetical protein
MGQPLFYLIYRFMVELNILGQYASAITGYGIAEGIVPLFTLGGGGFIYKRFADWRVGLKFDN